MEPLENDELTRRITNRLGELKRKQQRLDAWEKPAKKISLPPFLLMAVAACLVVVVMLLPMGKDPSLQTEDLTTISFDAYRGANPMADEIVQLVEAEEFADALNKVENALLESDEAIRDLGENCSLFDEGTMYEMDLELQWRDELRWTRICILFKEQRLNEAKSWIQDYLTCDECTNHRGKAKRLLKKIEKNN